MPLIKRFEEIQGWQEARKLNKLIYSATTSKPFHTNFGLIDQLRRASISIMANIAEGFDCDSPLEFARFLGIARRSVVEVQSLLYIALDIGCISKVDFDTYFQQAEKTKALVGGLKHSLRPLTKTKSVKV